MKSLLIAAFLVLLSTPGWATVCHKTCPPPQVTNVTNVTNVTEETNITNVTEFEHNAFDYGTFLDVVVFETKNTEWGTHATYLYESNETRVYVGGKIYLNRILSKKESEYADVE